MSHVRLHRVIAVTLALLLLAAAAPAPQEAPPAAAAPALQEAPPAAAPQLPAAAPPSTTESFPESWFGTWRGPARAENRDGTGFSFDVEIRVGPTADPNRYQWTIIYESSEMRRQERPYELVVRDRAKGLYAIDEKNGIVIDAWHSGGALFSHFVVEGNRISVVERLSTGPSGEPEIAFELVTVADEDLRDSGGEGGMPSVRAAAPRSVQRSVLKRTAPK